VPLSKHEVVNFKIDVDNSVKLVSPAVLNSVFERLVDLRFPENIPHLCADLRWKIRKSG
jgi:hypothetical protein